MGSYCVGPGTTEIFKGFKYVILTYNYNEVKLQSKTKHTERIEENLSNFIMNKTIITFSLEITWQN